jgi:hypothetical protein
MDSQKTIPLTLIGLSIVIAIQIVGFALLWNEITSQQQYIYLPTENKQGATTGTQTNPVVAVTRFPTESVLRETIRSVLKQEMSAYAHKLAAAPCVELKAVTDNKENLEANAQAFEKLSNIVDVAIARGQWTMEDTTAASTYSASITENQRRDLMEKVGGAVNGQTMKLSPDAPPVF